MSRTFNNILVIDDEISIRQSIVDYLEDHEYVALQADNGAKGLEMFREHGPDLVFTDLRMPEMDGIQVLSHIHEQSPETPIIVISGTGNIDDSVQALLSGAWDYIIKPIHDMSIVSLAIERAEERVTLLRENRAYQENLENLVQERTQALQQANEQLSEINARLRKLIDSTGELAKCSDMERFGSTLLNEFTKHMTATGGSLFFIEEGGLRLVFTKDPQRVPEFIPFPLPDDSILQQVLQDGRPLLVEDIAKSSGISSGGWPGYENESVLAFPLPDEDGQVVGILTLHNKTSPPFVEQDREIGSILASFSRETIRAIQDSDTIRAFAEQQKTTLNSLNVGVFIIDAEDNTIVDVNSEAMRLLGVPGNEIVGCKRYDFLPFEFEFGSNQPDSVRSEFDSESILISPSRGKIPIQRNVVSINLNGKTHYLESLIDITTRKEMEKEKEKLEAQLMQAQKMEAIGTLAGGLAHDLNNALSGIVSPVSMMLHKIGKASEIPLPKLERYLEGIQLSSFRITDMVNQLMAVSQKHELILTAVDLNFSIKHVVKLAKGTFDKSIEIKSKPYNTPATTVADPTQIEQVLLNLLINAAHAMTIMRGEDEAWGGILDISIELIHSNQVTQGIQSDSTEEEYWLITIKDTGVGIPESEISKIFTPFYTSKDKEQGTGLGLAMVFNIVKQHKGTIAVESVPGEGTGFYLYLPRKQAKGSAQKEKPDSDALKGKGLILVVDDEPGIKEATIEILNEFGYEVVTAGNGDEALQVLERWHEDIDLILLDLVMPKMAGDEAFRAINNRYPQIPVVLVSGFKQDKRIQSIMENSDVAFLQKPFDIYTLAECIKENIRSRKPNQSGG